MAENAEAQHIFLGASGGEYAVEEGADGIRPARGMQLAPSDDVVFVPLGERAGDSSLEDAIRRHVKLTADLPKTLTRQVSTIVDVAYDEGRFAGFIATSLRKGVTLTDFLDEGHARSMRIRVARNLCVAVLSALTRGRGLGRLSPDRILIDGATCRVFIGQDYPAAFSSGELAQYLRQRSTLPDPACDLALHAYCLLQEYPSGNLERGLWKNRLASLFSGPAPVAVRQRVLEATPLSWSERMRQRLGRAYRAPRLKGVPRSVEPLLRSVLLEGTSTSASALAALLCEKLECRQSAGEALRERLTAHRRRLSQGLGREAAVRFERRPWGLRGVGQSSTFWLTTLWTSLALGCCSMVNGFAPFDVLVGGSFSFARAGAGDGAAWQYPVAAVVGSAVYNAVVARRHYFRGYTMASYGWSVMVGTAFMTLPRVVFLALQGGVS